MKADPTGWAAVLGALAAPMFAASCKGLASVYGRVNFILDNLIAEGKALLMIVVMPRGHVVADRQIDREKNNEVLEQAMVREIVPYVDTHYRVRAGRANRAIAGLSMGGGQTLRFGLRKPEQFAWVIGLSPAIRWYTSRGPVSTIAPGRTWWGG